MDEVDQSFIDHSIKFETVNIRAWLSHYSKCECIALRSVLLCKPTWDSMSRAKKTEFEGKLFDLMEIMAGARSTIKE